MARDQECALYAGFDAAGHAMEQKDQDAFTACLAQAGGNKGKAWDLYWPQYTQKRIFCANKNIGKGGYATLDGGDGLKDCWTKVKLEWTPSLRFILLLTDGLIPPSEAVPGKEKDLARKLVELYRGGGIPAIVEWRDKVEAEKNTLTHVSGWPEGTAVMLNF
ncbi:MAG: hypothetical protein Q7S10_02430 [bacterium]|nr:hypothetical protein [bacterium]